MTRIPTPSERLAIRLGNAALLDSPDASVDLVATVVFALGAAGLLAEVIVPQQATAALGNHDGPEPHRYRVCRDLPLPGGAS